MNTRIRTAVMHAAIVSTLFFGSEEPTSAQSTDDCMKVKGRLIQDSSSGRNLGTITNGGILNGRTEIVFATAAFPTPDPTTVSFIGDLTLATHRGVLKTHDVYLFDVFTGVGTGIHRVDANASTGVFSGARGVLYDNSKSTGPSTVQGNVTGELCFADK